jgi:isopentenyl-diphosphate delta-isomerase type 1
MTVRQPDEGAASDEMIDIVDANDQVIGSAPRREVHARGLRHRAVHMLILDGQGRIYLQRRSADKDVDPGLWDTSAAGHVDSGEDYLTAAHRELGEELALHDVALRRLGELPAQQATGHEFVRVYVGCSTLEPRPDPREIAAGGWWSVTDIVQWLAREPAVFTATFQQIFAQYRQHLSQPSP